MIEVAIAAQAFIRDLALRLKADGGVALFLDYGHTKSGFGDTLHNSRAFRQSWLADGGTLMRGLFV